MKTSNKIGQNAFTLVELIVVITILAILGTLAFINLAGYNNEAKNGKVVSDLRNIASLIEVSRTTKGVALLSIVQNASTNNTVAATNIINNGTTALNGAGIMYSVGNVDFSVLRQNGTEFKDPNSFDGEQEYIYGVVNSGDFSYYQMAGQIIENDVQKVRVIGTYYQINSATDVIGILSTKANDNPIENDMVIPGDLYQ